MVSTAGTQGLGFTSPGKVISGDDLALVTGQSVYVPAYSDIFFADTERTWDLAVTLAIHNTDAENPLTITSVRYYDTDGNLIKEYLDAPIKLKTLASTRYIIPEGDKTPTPNVDCLKPDFYNLSLP